MAGKSRTRLTTLETKTLSLLKDCAPNRQAWRGGWRMSEIIRTIGYDGPAVFLTIKGLRASGYVIAFYIDGQPFETNFEAWRFYITIEGMKALSTGR